MPPFAHPTCRCTGERLIFVHESVCHKVIRLECGTCYRLGSPILLLRDVIDFCELRDKKDVQNATQRSFEL